MAAEIRWGVVVDHETRESHVYPLEDIVEHDFERGAEDRCACGPRVELITTDHGDYWEFMHHSLDGREASE